MATILRNARAAFAGLLAVLVAGCGGSGGREALPGPVDFDTSFGGSSLGTWIDDELGLPAFRYDGCTAGYPVVWCVHDGGHTIPQWTGPGIAAFFQQF